MTDLQMLIDLIEEDIVPGLNMGDFEKSQLRDRLRDLSERADREERAND